jgi:hypothetical protein
MHVKHTEKLEIIMKDNKDILTTLHQQSSRLTSAVIKAVEEADIKAGNITMPILLEKLNEHQKVIETLILNNNVGISRQDNNLDINDVEMLPTIATMVEVKKIKFPAYCYNGKLNDAPKGYKLPKNPTHQLGWTLWLIGQKASSVLVNGLLHSAPIKPFRQITTKGLPKKEERKKIFFERKPICVLMGKTPGLKIPRDPQDISTQFVLESYKVSTEFLKTCIGYVWDDDTKNITEWLIATWSKRSWKSEILKNGSDTDKKIYTMKKLII